MNRERYLLDTSVILTLIEDEQGADRVEQVLKTGQVFLPWPALLEVYYITLQEKGQEEAEYRYALLKRWSVTILWDMDEPVLLSAGRLKAAHHMSLADAIVAAFALQNAARLLHKDPEFDALKGQVAMEALPYKP